MKKVLLFALIIVAVSTASAQAPRVPDPAQHQMIKNAEAHYMKSYNNKGNSLKTPDINRLNQRDQEGNNTANYYYSGSQRASDNYGYACKMLKSAERQKEKAKKNLAKLPEKQQREMSKLQKKYDKALAKGMSNEQRQKMDVEMMMLKDKHAYQFAQAQENLQEAVRRYDKAVERLNKARLEVEKYR